MKKFLRILVLSLLLSVNAYAGKQDMISALKGMPVVVDAAWPQDISLWIFMSNPNVGHDFDRLGYTVCNGAVTNFGVQKGYSITFGIHIIKNKLVNIIATNEKDIINYISGLIVKT